MNKIREIIRLKEHGLTQRQIARALHVSRPVVAQYLTDLKGSGLTYSSIQSMSDDDLLAVFAKKKGKSKRHRTLDEQFEYMARELKKKGVTLYLLWEEYRRQHPDGYGYSQFCYHFQVWRNLSSLTMHIEHKAGDKMFVDFTGKKMKFFDREAKEFQETEVFVAILGASQLTYVEAVLSQQKEDWLKVNDNALWYLDGVPAAIVPDCLKSGVTKADKYEPDTHPDYADFASYYGTAILPARPNSPKDKALVENAVGIVYKRIYAPLRDRTFYSLDELNEAIWEKLEEHNNKHFQISTTSRRQLFEEIELPALKPLPSQRYEIKRFLKLKVQFNYHVEIREDRHYYSVPWKYLRKHVKVIYTATVVEVYYNNIRIAFHKRDRNRNNRYTTVHEHMPPNHRLYAEWSPQRLINWGGAIGPNTKQMVEEVLQSRKHPEQAFKVCLGLLNLSKRYGDGRLDRACERALQFRSYSYKFVKNVLEKGLDRIQAEEPLQQTLPVHENIRGKHYYESEATNNE
ncbi:MAG: IS21 family transposase [Desulfobulbaceae bacterium]|uniref:IS21 family transposase n=1 Tax=Candidatus Desulfobia pelagia TaxID=2841692 RepID=A0A8J6NHV2_9BACT|nr:IS21 family transposase [Candidatus Desulfobia pelagia]